LIDRGASLVSDDQVELNGETGRLIAAAPATIAGHMEVRGIGIIAVEHKSPMAVSLLVELASPPRMPDPGSRRLEGIDIPVIALAALEASAPIKVELALRQWGLEV
jgi:serine kinase of HPr protein (carbohydrate metabolism regulator)